MAERLAERAEMHRHRLRVRIAAWTGVALALAAAVWVVLFSPAFALDPQEVSISGEGTVIDVDSVADVVSAQAGVPLPLLDTVGLRENILALNGVKDVSISRSWPRGIEVSLVSREPVAAIPVDGAYALVDVDAVAVAHTDQPPVDLPEITIPWDQGETVSRSLHAALVLLAALSPELRAEVAEVSAATQDDVEMLLRDGVRVMWGGANDAALKVKVFSTLRALPDNVGVTVYDVSVPRMPVTR